MDQAIRISTLNDFIFCPRSIYFHDLYGQMNQSVYHETDQQQGLQSHETIDHQKYATKKHILQGTPLYSTEYRLIGKLDLFNSKTGTLRERKHHIKKIYLGYVYQLYAQYVCLQEMGYTVKSMKLHSKIDNKSYPIPLPKKHTLIGFERFLSKYRSFLIKGVNAAHFSQNSNKCNHCIYANLCDFYLLNHPDA